MDLAALRALCQFEDEYKRPIKGKLKSLVLNVIPGGEYQVIIQYFFVEKWTVVRGTDPAAILAEAISRVPDMEPFPPSTPAFVKAVDPEPPGGLGAPTGDLSDLLV